MKATMDSVIMRFETDYDVVLECIQEVYGLEGEFIRRGKDFRKTIVLPFMKMLERHCGGVKAAKLHKVLWSVYQESRLVKAKFRLEPILCRNFICGLDTV